MDAIPSFLCCIILVEKDLLSQPFFFSLTSLIHP